MLFRAIGSPTALLELFFFCKVLLKLYIVKVCCINTRKLKLIFFNTGVNVQEIESTDVAWENIHLTFQDFCCIVAEFENQSMESRRLWDLFTQSLKSPIQKIVGMYYFILALSNICYYNNLNGIFFSYKAFL